jgi:hypothetical protein
MAELVESARAEPGVLTYEWAMSDDGSLAHIYERFTDSASALAHLAIFRERFATRFLTTVDPIRLVVYGSPGTDVQEAVAALRPLRMSLLGGFHSSCSPSTVARSEKPT